MKPESKVNIDKMAKEKIVPDSPFWFNYLMNINKFELLNYKYK